VHTPAGSMARSASVARGPPRVTEFMSRNRATAATTRGEGASEVRRRLLRLSHLRGLPVRRPRAPHPRPAAELLRRPRSSAPPPCRGSPTSSAAPAPAGQSRPAPVPRHAASRGWSARSPAAETAKRSTPTPHHIQRRGERAPPHGRSPRRASRRWRPARAVPSRFAGWRSRSMTPGQFLSAIARAISAKVSARAR
jgi:hypothetical protein